MGSCDQYGNTYVAFHFQPIIGRIELLFWLSRPTGFDSWNKDNTDNNHTDSVYLKNIFC